MTGIYKIFNKVNGKIYIGEGIKIESRCCQHKSYLRHNRIGRESSHLQNAWNKYGEESFEFSIEKECLPEELKYWEEYFIELYESWKPEKGYNIERYSNGAKIVSEETREKIREKRREQIITEEHKKNISISLKKNSFNLGKKMSEEQKEKISNTLKGRKLSEEIRNKISAGITGNKNPMFGKENKWGHHSAEAKQKISESHRGENASASKLVWKQVREIREKYIPKKYTAKMLAEEYGVTEKCIRNIINNKTWKEECK